MATNTQGPEAHDLGIGVVHAIRKDFTFADLTTATAVKKVGVLPVGAVVLRCTTATFANFDDTTADDLDVGYTAGGAELGSAMDINTPVIDAGDIAAADMAPLTEAKTVYFAPTTGATGDGTTGSGTIIVEYVTAGGN